MTPNRLLALFLAFIAIVIFIVVLIARGGNPPQQQSPTGVTVQPLPEYASTDAEVSATTQGIVNGDELHRSIRITVSGNSRELEIIEGYSGTVVSRRNFDNTEEAYAVFLRAINGAGFLSKLPKSKYPADERGQCPLGQRYIFALNQDFEDLSRTWASSCGRAVGTSGGNTSTLLTLFRNQIPNYSQLTSDVNLSATSTD
ncbi:MAG TPA: hypothetical protein VFW52_00275 [Candidatus Saccharimonadales bacterium]|nr:hypothetical protein [Candidatus Saccharimonadales bacterium]